MWTHYVITSWGQNHVFCLVVKNINTIGSLMSSAQFLSFIVQKRHIPIFHKFLSKPQNKFSFLQKFWASCQITSVVYAFYTNVTAPSSQQCPKHIENSSKTKWSSISIAHLDLSVLHRSCPWVSFFPSKLSLLPSLFSFPSFVYLHLGLWISPFIP